MRKQRLSSRGEAEHRTECHSAVGEHPGRDHNTDQDQTQGQSQDEGQAQDAPYDDPRDRSSDDDSLQRSPDDHPFERASDDYAPFLDARAEQQHKPGAAQDGEAKATAQQRRPLTPA
jgi:hypothetical protein